MSSCNGIQMRKKINIIDCFHLTTEQRPAPLLLSGSFFCCSIIFIMIEVMLGGEYMKKLLLFLFVFVLLAGCSVETDHEWLTVERVVDGDTFVLVGGDRVRMIGVDTPETVKPGTAVQTYGKEASDFTKKMLTGKKVRLEYDVSEKDRYGRLLAYVYLEDGTFYNELLLKEGYAQVMTVPPNVKYADHFVEVQRKARVAKKGLWGLDPNQVGQTDVSEQKNNASSTSNDGDLNKRYVDANGRGLIKGNINSKGEKIYHMPGGASYEVTSPEEWFTTEQEALDAGFRRAKR